MVNKHHASHLNLPSIAKLELSTRSLESGIRTTTHNNTNALQDKLKIAISNTTPTTNMAIIKKQQLILALNAGSSSLKASLLEGDSKEIAHFLGERLNTSNGVVHLPGDKSIQEDNMTHEQALGHVIDYLREQHYLDHLVAIGHRVVHGGTTFTSSVVVDDKELQQIKDVSHLAPL